MPPIAALYAFSALGIDGMGLPPEEVTDGLPAHMVWPFVASALNYSGTKGPCFFLARSLKADAHGQLAALLKKAATKSITLAKTLKDYLPLIEATAAKQPAPSNSMIASTLTMSGTSRDENRENLGDLLAKRRELAPRGLQAAYDHLIATFVQSDSVGACIMEVVEGKADLGDDKFPTLRSLIAAASDREDIAPVARILADSELKTVATQARKAIAEIDYALFGPEAPKTLRAI